MALQMNNTNWGEKEIDSICRDFTSVAFVKVKSALRERIQNLLASREQAIRAEIEPLTLSAWEQGHKIGYDQAVAEYEGKIEEARKDERERIAFTDEGWLEIRKQARTEALQEAREIIDGGRWGGPFGDISKKAATEHDKEVDLMLELITSLTSKQ